MATWHHAITDVPGIRVGHATDKEAETGCTVVLCPRKGAVGGVDQGAAVERRVILQVVQSLQILTGDPVELSRNGRAPSP